MSNVHIVVKNDSLSKISKIYGISITELQNINHLPNPNKLQIGQRIALKKENVLGFQTLILDKDRNPISAQAYQFVFAGRVINGVTGADGLTKKIMTVSPQDEVRILIERFDKSMKEVATVMSGYGNKLVTILSQSVKVEARTEKHPNLKLGEIPNTKEKVAPIYDPKAKQSPTTDKKELGLKATPAKTSDGKPLIKVEGDIPDLSFLGEYVGGEVTKEDIEAAAKELKCEPGLIYAIARQESAHSSFIKIGGRTVPTILYERHIFSRYSNRVFDDKYPDISTKTAYHKVKKVKVVIKGKKGKKDKITWEMIDSKTGEAPLVEDVYARPGLQQYIRLVKAYQLDKSAALQACSWGKFQIMGFNYKAAGYKDVFEFVRGMCTGDPAHIKAFLMFAKSNRILLAGLREKDYKKIAKGHNGDQWNAINPEYPTNIEKFYKEYTKDEKKS